MSGPSHNKNRVKWNVESEKTKRKKLEGLEASA